MYGTPGYFTMPIYGVDKYDVYKSVDGEFILIGTAGPLSTSFIDEVPDGTTVYEYMVTYVDGNPDHEQMTSSVWAMANANVNPSDFNSDSVVDISDFAMFASVYGMTADQPSWVNLFDIYLDGVVDISDFASFAGDYGFGVAKAAKVIVGIEIP